ncbi:MAG TPA: hypothetical protein VJZ32_07480 [Candidatus Bathyarchaeia archaeon]|nr:hypothetical protein [Candidatus Bathyarchaeia archaeon]
MMKEEHAALKQWLKKRYPLLFLSVNERTDHAFAIVDLPSVSPDPIGQSFGCKITLSTPRQAENDFLRTADYQCTTLFDSHGWKKRLLEISRR